MALDTHNKHHKINVILANILSRPRKSEELGERGIGAGGSLVRDGGTPT